MNQVPIICIKQQHRQQITKKLPGSTRTSKTDHTRLAQAPRTFPTHSEDTKQMISIKKQIQENAKTYRPSLHHT